jgi:hypothetical protein
MQRRLALHDVDFTLLVSENLCFYFANVFYNKNFGKNEKR